MYQKRKTLIIRELSLGQRGYVIGGGAAYEFHKITVGGLTAAESCFKIEGFLVLLGILAELVCHKQYAFLVEIVIEGKSGVLANAVGNVDTVGSDVPAQCLNGGIGIAPNLISAHDGIDIAPQVLLI